MFEPRRRCHASGVKRREVSEADLRVGLCLQKEGRDVVSWRRGQGLGRRHANYLVAAPYHVFFRGHQLNPGEVSRRERNLLVQAEHELIQPLVGNNQDRVIAVANLRAPMFGRFVDGGVRHPDAIDVFRSLQLLHCIDDVTRHDGAGEVGSEADVREGCHLVHSTHHPVCEFASGLYVCCAHGVVVSEGFGCGDQHDLHSHSMICNLPGNSDRGFGLRRPTRTQSSGL